MLNIRRTPLKSAEDYKQCGCTLIWDSGTIFSRRQRGQSPHRKKIFVDGDFVHRNRVLAKIKFYELKNRRPTSKLKIQFDDDNVQTHEYPKEEVALEEYLSKNPTEVEEAKREEREREEEPTEGGNTEEEPQTAREESPLKTNTPLTSGSGELSSYKPKHQEEFQFGMSLKEPEPVKEPEVATETEDDLHLRPADEDDLHDFSTHDTSDMLF